ncbi:hypothetical protein IID19_02380 [Patescibacteria group bacterium]|nr:hypothetical protein [Patescibacteria group bacterium]
MHVLKQLFVIIRPVQCATAAFAVIAFASIATEHLMLTPTVIAATIAMALLVLACSVYHCAFQKHNQPFTRKVNDYISQPRPWLLGPIAAMAFIDSVGISISYLPIGATATILVAGGLVVVYTRNRGQATLNPLVALICSAPVLVGWFASGIPLSGWTYFFMAFTYLLYLMREDIKDSQESGLAHEHIIANRESHENAPGGGAMTIYLIVPIGGTLMFAATHSGLDYTTNLFGMMMLLILFPMSGIIGFFHYATQLKKSYQPIPQALMTAFVWVYLLVCTAALPMIS